MGNSIEKLPSDKSFGFFISLIFILFSGYFYLKNNFLLCLLLFLLAITFLIALIIKPALFFHLKNLWIRFGYMLSSIFNPLIMAIIFFGLFTPIAILSKSFGRDELQLKIKKKKSYWILKKDLSEFSESFTNQF